MAPIPQGINNLGFITILGSAGLVAFAGLAYEVQSASPFPFALKLIFVSWEAFGLVGIVLSSVLIGGSSSKHLWRAFMIYWISLLAFWVGWDLRDPSGTWRSLTYGPGFAIEVFGPIVYSVCCIVYFFSKIPKRYFHFENSDIQTLNAA